MDFQAVKRQLDECAPKPRHYRLMEIIEEHVHSNHLKPGQRLPSQRELISKLSISNATVDRAIRELTTRGIIYRKQGLGTFVADRTKSKPSTIAVLIPAYPGAPYDRDIVWNIEDAAHQAGYDVLFCNTEDDLSKIDSYLEKFFKKKVDGVIYVPAAISKGYYEENISRIRRLQAAGVEVVLCDRNFLNIPDAVLGFGLDCVYSDDVMGSMELVEHLLESGRKSVALISGPMDSNVENRIVGYRKAMAAHDSVSRGDLVRFIESYDPREIADIVDKLVKLPDKPDAIFAINDRIAEMVMNALMAKGVSIPQEIAVAGYDNYEMGQYLVSPLTSVDRNTHEMGRMAMKLLLEKISGERNTPRHIALPTKLVVRESSGGGYVGQKAKQMAIT
ncbi:MAG: GntR family transcriptional regulator [Phycisphaerae bacterium]|nr:GntR family transcriptional regulator [Phycisphaerae bacterium]